MSLEVHHGHALGALRHLDGTGKGWGPQDVSCPSLKLLRIVFTSPFPLRYSAIAQSCLQLLEERPSLRIEWHEHLVPNASWRQDEAHRRDKDDNGVKSWQDIPDGVKKGEQCFWDGHEVSLAGIYSVESL